MAFISYTTNIRVDLAHYEICHAKVGRVYVFVHLFDIFTFAKYE